MRFRPTNNDLYWIPILKDTNSEKMLNALWEAKLSACIKDGGIIIALSKTDSLCRIQEVLDGIDVQSIQFFLVCEESEQKANQFIKVKRVASPTTGSRKCGGLES